MSVAGGDPRTVKLMSRREKSEWMRRKVMSPGCLCGRFLAQGFGLKEHVISVGDGAEEVAKVVE